MKILEIIRQHCGDEFFLSFSQDEETTVIHTGATQQCNGTVFVVPNDMFKPVYNCVKRNNHKFINGKFKFCGDRWIYDAEYSTTFVSNIIFI